MKSLNLFSVTLLEFFSAPTRTYIITSYTNIFYLAFIFCFNYADSFRFYLFIFSMSEMTRCIEGSRIELCFRRFCIFREEIFLEIDFFYGFTGFRCEESFCHSESNSLNQANKLCISLFLVDYQWIFLSISLKSYFFSEVCHAVDMCHPEFIDSGK